MTIVPERPELAASEETVVQVTVEPPAGFSGTQAINVHAFRTEMDRPEASAILDGGVTFMVSAS